MISDTVRLKLQDLIERAPSLVAGGARTLVGAHPVPRDAHHMAKCSAWITETLNVISYAIPSPENPYRAQIEHAGEGTNILQRIASIAETLRALLPDIEPGFWEIWATKFARRRLIIFLITARHTSLMIEKWRRG